jgi:hypothetical protein
MKNVFSSCVFIVWVLVAGTYDVHGQQDWAALHDQLHQKIEQDYDQPPDSERWPEVWYSWIDSKGADRNKVLEVLNQLNTLHINNPDNKEYSNWVQKFSELLLYAEESGTRTVNAASMKLLRITIYSSWENTYMDVNEIGRKIYSRAQANNFNTYYPRERSRCLINFSIGDLESSRSGGGLYADRDLRFGYLDDEGYMNLPDRDFSVECERRGEFERFSEGRPQHTIDWAITQVDMLRDECEWWKFTGERQDATDLLNEYYEDALCKTPPHKYKMGHKYFRDLIKETDGTEKSVEYNEGFYGTLYGKVEVREFGVLKPAPGAKVVINDYDETWTTTADAQGNYEINGAILHKDCGPFKIYATWEGDRVDDTYEGPLEEPDKNYRHNKDLVIIPKHEYNWFGEITIEYWELKDCVRDTATEASRTIIHEEGERRQKAEFFIMAKDDGGGYRALTQLIFNDMHAMGTINGLYYSDYQLNFSSDNSRRDEHQKIMGYGQFNADQKDLALQIASVAIVDNAEKYKQMAMELMKSGDPKAIENANKELDKILDGGTGNEFPVKVILQMPAIRNAQSSYMDIRTRWTKDKGTVVETNESGFKNMPVVMPINVIMEGNYTKGKDGMDRIKANYNESERIPSMNKDCPPVRKAISASLTMHRKRTK